MGYQTAVQQNHFHERLGYLKIPDSEIDELKKEYDALLLHYGDHYRHDYGWASKVLENKKPTFRDIEAAVTMDHLRPAYKAASFNIHSNPIGLIHRLGLSINDENLLSGPSDRGLRVPGDHAISTLLILNATILTYQANLDFLVVCRTMASFAEDARNAFAEAEMKFFGGDYE